MKELAQTQRIWRTIAQSPNDGFFVWEILEVVGNVGNDSPTSYYSSTIDNGYIYVMCFHYWNKVTALAHFDSPSDKWLNQEVIKIGEPV